MTPVQRCDEIIRMIDEVLDAAMSVEVGTLGAGSHQPSLDRRFATAGFEAGR
jgi:hypothetical protein